MMINSNACYCTIILLMMSSNGVFSQDTPRAQTMALLGKSFWPPSINLLELLKAGTQVYNGPDVENCLSTVHVSESPSTLEYYKSNEAFYRSFGANLDIALSVISFGSISGTLGFIEKNFQETSRQSSQLDYGHYVESFDLNKGCLANALLNPAFESEIQDLPLTIDINSTDAFGDYKRFVGLYGGFIVTGVTTGARLQVFATAEKTFSYSEKQFSTRVCAQISLASVTGIPSSVGPCVGFSQTQLESSLSLEMSTRYFVRGGDRTLQTQLSTQGIKTDVLTEFIQSATTNPYPVDYRLTPLWDIYTGDDENITQKLDNLRRYFLFASEEETRLFASDSIHQFTDLSYALLGIIQAIVFVALM